MLAFNKLTHRLIDLCVLMRLHRPVGIWLLLWPTLIALWLSSEGQPSIKLICIFTLGVIVMRSAGCVINDWADRKVDGYVERTKLRPLVTGKVSSAEALILFCMLIFVAFLLVCAMDLATLYCSIGALILACVYPFMKRYTHFPQVVLGAAYGWAVPMVYMAQQHRLPWECWLLFAAILLWTIAYDTLYAMADSADDLKIGIKSTAIAFGKWDKKIVAVLHMLTIALLVIVGKRLALGAFFYLGLCMAFGLACYQQWLIRSRSPEKCLQAFLNNQWFGGALFLGTILG